MPAMSAAGVAAIVAAVVLAALAVLQILLAAGRPYGRFAWGGGHRVLPAGLRVGSAVAVVLYAVFVLVLFDRSSLIEVFGGGGFAVVATWVLFGFFTLGIAMNAISRSKAERFTMTPVNVVLAACSLVVALS